MKSLFTTLIVLAIGCTPSFPVRAGTAVNSDNAMVIDGVIQGNNLKKIEAALLAKQEGEVDLVINSPGGSVSTGFRFVSVMEDAKARGIRINCFVGSMAASMAFQILLHCDEKHVLDRSFLLWHRARIMMGGMGGSPQTAPQLGVLSADLGRIDALIFSEVESNIKGMPHEALVYHFENETMHVGEMLASESSSFTSSSSVSGLYEALANTKLPRTEEELPFGFSFGGGQAPVVPLRNDLSSFEFGEIIYIK